MARLLNGVRDLALLIWAVATLLFFLLRATGDPVVALAGADASEEQLQALRARFGLDQPLPIQYLNYLLDLARLDFGVSMASGSRSLARIRVPKADSRRTTRRPIRPTPMTPAVIVPSRRP